VAELPAALQLSANYRRCTMLARITYVSGSNPGQQLSVREAGGAVGPTSRPNGPDARVSRVWVLAIVNEKGGSAKTTTTVNLAAALAERDRRVLVVDLDAQANASLWLGVPDEGQALLEVLLGERAIDDAIRSAPALSGVDVLPASRRLGNLAAHVGWADFPQGLLRERMAALREDYDYALLDGPRAVDLLSTNALVAAQAALVPLIPETLAYLGLVAMDAAIKSVRPAFNPTLEGPRVLRSRWEDRTLDARAVLAQTEAQFGPSILRSVVRADIAVRHAARAGRPVLAGPRSRAGEDFRALAGEVEQWAAHTQGGTDG
jgi:chromosome partitioning protein